MFLPLHQFSGLNALDRDAVSLRTPLLSQLRFLWLVPWWKAIPVRVILRNELFAPPHSGSQPNSP